MDRPFAEGADQVTTATVPLTFASEVVGEPGVVYGVIDEDDDEYEPVPTALMAATVNV